MQYSYMAYQIHVTYSFAREKCSRADMCIAIVQPLIQDIALLRYEVMPGTIKRITDISGTLKAILFGDWFFILGVINQVHIQCQSFVAKTKIFLNNFGILFIMCPSFCVPQRPKAPTTNAASQCILISTKLQFCRFNVNFRP